MGLPLFTHDFSAGHKWFKFSVLNGDWLYIMQVVSGAAYWPLVQWPAAVLFP
jgi:hypothetical protein